MKKTALFLAFMLLLSMVVLASCDLINPPVEELACQHVDRNADLVCDLCQAAVDAIPQPEVPDIGNPDWKPEGDDKHIHKHHTCNHHSHQRTRTT